MRSALLAVALLACAPAPRPPVPDLEPALDHVQRRAEAAGRRLDAEDRFLAAAERAAVLRPGPERKRASRRALVGYVAMREARDEAEGFQCR